MTAKNAFEKFIDERFEKHTDYDFFSSQSTQRKLEGKILDCLGGDTVSKEFIDYCDTSFECMRRAYALGFRDATEIFVVTKRDKED